MPKQTNRKVPLDLITDAIEMANDEWNQYLDIKEMEVVSLPEYPFMGQYDEEDQELSELIDEEWNVRFFALPSKYDIHEYSIMEQFIWDLPEGQIQSDLAGAIRGKGAFRRFKDSVFRFGIEQSWYDYQEAAYRQIAIEWCEDHGFTYMDKHPVSSKGTRHTGSKNDTNALAWEEIRTEHLVQDEWIDFRRSAYRFPDGKVFEPFYSYSRRDYVVIAASDTEGNYLCVRQFRQGIRKVTTEFPAGGIEQKDSKKYVSGNLPVKDALAAAKRELLEETGYESDEWSHLLTVPSNATLSDNHAYLFAAKNCRKVSGQSLDETEFLNVKKFSAKEIDDMITNGEFQQVVHITAWLLLLRSDRFV